VWSYYSNKWLRQQPNRKNYLVVKLFFNGYPKSVAVHRLVAYLYVPNPHNHPQVNHKDGNKQHNHARNLEWVTNRENQIHAWETGLQQPHGYKPLAQYTIGGKFLRVFRSLKVAARKYNILPNNLSTAASGKAAYCGKYQWRLVCNGKIPRRLPALPPLTLPARNTTTGQVFHTSRQLEKSGYSFMGVNRVVLGKQLTHMGCGWKRLDD